MDIVSYSATSASCSLGTKAQRSGFRPSINPSSASNYTLLAAVTHLIMHVFSRLLSALGFLLSFGLIVNALPSGHNTGIISHRQQTTPEHYNGKSGYYENGQSPGPNSDHRTDHNVGDVQGEVWTLKGRLDTKLALLGKSRDIDEAKARVEVVVDIIKEECSRLSNISVKIPVEVHLKIAHVVIKIFTELISACVKLSLKFGAPLVINLLAEIDAAFSGYLLVLTTCVPGLSPVLNNVAIQINGDVVADLHVVGLVQCAKLLGLVSNVPSVAQ
ncbi:hypothetical protein B0J17DRAFT_645537 [Rhizoctonia solani]|nr:hypothetical protein B0J17DRAFT_645537 [Rhizoctonia solani]